MAHHEMDFGFTNESKNIDSYGDIAFLKRSQTSRTPCRPLPSSESHENPISSSDFHIPKIKFCLHQGCVE